MLFGLAIAALACLPSTLAQFNNPPDVDIWCGKAYRATNASFNPGGFFEEPDVSDVPLLNLKIRPRMNLYLQDEIYGSFLVDAAISWLVGQPYGASNVSTPVTNTSTISIKITSDGNASIVLNQTFVKLGSTENELPFDLSTIPASLDPYNITLLGTLAGNTTTFSATTQLFKLPSRTDNGTATRIDNLYGGMSVRKAAATDWTPIFPYTYYVQWSLYWYANLSTLNEFASMGYNVIHIVPTGNLSDTPFPWDEFMPYLDRADELGLYFMYDVRWDYTNLTTMIDQVTRLHNHPSILLWYGSDEPDGQSKPLNSTLIEYNTIRAIDPYHPVSLALNCFNFYYSSYASGAEIILSDVYPISTNTSWSTEYLTPCNSTYGCCGCDDCSGSFTDISNRLDTYAHFDEVLGWQKTHWGAPQAFGNETFWTRYPTAAEEAVMTALYVNHGSKGLVMWDFPTTADILNVTNALAKIFTSEEVGEYLIGAKLYMGLEVLGAEEIDAAAWVGEDGILISIINLSYADVKGNISVALPEGVSVGRVVSTLWGDASWNVQGGGVVTGGLLGLEVSLLMLK